MTIAATQPCSDESTCAIWNPTAAVCWSLLFTPAFGAFIHMRNWQALDQPERAATARHWFHASLGMLLLQVFTGALNVRLGTEPMLLHPVGLLFLLVWYVAAARPHILLVRARCGTRYRHQRWDAVVLGAVVAGAAYACTGTLLSLLLVALT